MLSIQQCYSNSGLQSPSSCEDLLPLRGRGKQQCIPQDHAPDREGGYFSTYQRVRGAFGSHSALVKVPARTEPEVQLENGSAFQSLHLKIPSPEDPQKVVQGFPHLLKPAAACNNQT